MKKIFFTLLIIFIIQPAIAQKNNNDRHKWYVGSNLLSYAMVLPLKDEIRRFGPVIAGNEYGFNVVGGYNLTPNWRTETRLSLGNIHQVAFIGQLHIGANYHFLFKQEKSKNHGLYSGVFLKYWDYYNRLTTVHFHNISPYLTAGYLWDKKKFMFDIRINQTVAVHSWTNLEDTKAGTDWFFSPWPEFIQVLPTLNFTIGYRL
jgi:hypothetical protein